MLTIKRFLAVLLCATSALLAPGPNAYAAAGEIVDHAEGVRSVEVNEPGNLPVLETLNSGSSIISSLTNAVLQSSVPQATMAPRIKRLDPGQSPLAVSPLSRTNPTADAVAGRSTKREGMGQLSRIEDSVQRACDPAGRSSAIEEIRAEADFGSSEEPAMRLSMLGLTQKEHENVVNPILQSAFQSEKIVAVEPGSSVYAFYDPKNEYVKNHTKVYRVLLTRKEYFDLAKKLAKANGARPPLDIVVHPGRSRNAVYYFGFQDKVMGRMSSADRSKIVLHELAHIRNPNDPEDRVQEDNPLPEVPNRLAAWIAKVPMVGKVLAAIITSLMSGLDLFLHVDTMFQKDDVIRPLLKKYRSQIALTTAFLAFDGVLVIFMPKLFGNLLDVAGMGHRLADIRVFYQVFLGTLGINLLYATVEFFHSYLINKISTNVVNDIRIALWKKLASFSSAFFVQNGPTSLAPRLTEDPGNIAQKNIRFPIATPHYLITFALSVTMLLLGGGYKGLLVIISLPIFSYFSVFFERLYEKYNKDYTKKRAEVSSQVTDMLSIFDTLKFYGIEAVVSEKLFQTIEDLRTIGNKRVRASAGYQIIRSSLLDFSTKLMVLLLLSWTLFFFGYPTVGTIYAFQGFAGAYQYSVGGLSDLQTSRGEAVGGSAFVLDVMNRPADIREAPDAHSIGSIKGEIELKSVSVYYGEKEALHDVNLKILPGQWVGIVGTNGSGKSTLFKTIGRLIDPRKGDVFIDGHNVRALKADFRRQFGIAPQGGGLFPGTVEENLKAVRPDVTREQILDALSVVDAEFLLRDPEKGLKRNIRELSGGEKQRVSLARIVIRDPQVIFLDEATSELDEIGQAEIQRKFRERFKGRTVISIAHRLTTLVDADVICVVDKGRIVAMGSHRELIKDRDGIYYKLWHAKEVP